MRAADTVDAFPAGEQGRIFSMVHKDGRGLEENGSQPDARPNHSKVISWQLIPAHSIHYGDNGFLV